MMIFEQAVWLSRLPNSDTSQKNEKVKTKQATHSLLFWWWRHRFFNFVTNFGQEFFRLFPFTWSD